MKKIILFLIVFLCEFNCFANTFSTKGHPKAQGLNIQINYPDGWEPEETETPIHIQRFVKDKNLCSLIIQRGDRMLLQQMSELVYQNYQDYIDIFVKDQMKEPFVRQFMILKHTPIVHDGQQGMITETFTQRDKYNIIVNSYCYDTEFIFNDAFVQLHCCSFGTEPPDVIKERFEKNKHDFVLFRDGLIFSDKRK